MKMRYTVTLHTSTRGQSNHTLTKGFIVGSSYKHITLMHEEYNAYSYQ